MVHTTQSLNRFEASILDAKGRVRTAHGDNYVCLNHGQKYRIGLRNQRNTRAVVEIKIDGKSVGNWVLGPYARATIERPVDIAKKFTFYREDSGEAESIGVVQGSNNNGLVECIFIAEQESHPQPIHHHHHHHHHRYRPRPDCTDLFHDWDDGDFQQSFQGDSFRANAQRKSSSLFADEACEPSSLFSSCRGAAHPPSAVVAGATGLQGHSNQTFGKARKVLRDMDTLTSICFRLVVSLPNSTRVPSRPEPLGGWGAHIHPAPPRPPVVDPKPQPEMGLVDEDRVQDLVDMGFADKRVCRRLLFFHDGDLKKCVKDLVRMEREGAAAAPEQAPVFRWDKELKTMLEEFGFEGEEQACKDALAKCEGDLKLAVRQVMTGIRK